jgi:hypothetical protein
VSIGPPPQNKPFQDLGRAPNGQLLPGHTANPGGKPKNLATLVQEILKRTHDGKDLVDWTLRVWQGKESIQLNGKALPPSWEVRMQALQWLTERAWGKPQVAIDVSAPSVIIVTGNGDVE